MKKVIFLIACIVFAITKAQAQDTILTIAQVNSSIGHQVHVCANQYERVLVYAPEGCTDFAWFFSDEIIQNISPITFDGSLSNYHNCMFHGCGYTQLGFSIYFDESNVPNYCCPLNFF